MSLIDRRNRRAKPYSLVERHQAMQLGGEMSEGGFNLEPIGVIRSELVRLEDAPRQGYEGAPDAWVEIHERFVVGLERMAIGDEIILITWFHLARRDVLKLHPRDDVTIPLTGVFSTRSPDRPNPLGLHRVKVLEISGNRIKVAPLEAIDGTPVMDIKPMLPQSADG